MNTKWLLIGVTVDGRQEFNDELGELTAEEATSKSAVSINSGQPVRALLNVGSFTNRTRGKVVSWELVSGQESTTICRGPDPGKNNCVDSGSGFPVHGTSYVDGPTICPDTSLPWVSTAGSLSFGRNGVAAPTDTTSRLNQFVTGQLAGAASCHNSSRSIGFTTKYHFPPVVFVFYEATKVA